MVRKKCFSCGKEKKFFAFNYAGYRVRKESYPFPERITEITLPGNKKEDFLCRLCANMTKIYCLLHGEISDSEFRSGSPPGCKKCEIEKQEDTRFGSPPKGYDALEIVSVPTNDPFHRAFYEGTFVNLHPCSCGGQWKLKVHNAPGYDGASGGGYECTVCKKKKWFQFVL